MNIGFDAKRAFYNNSGLGNYSRSTLNLLAKYFPDNKYFLFTPNTQDSIQFEKNNATIVEPEMSLYKFFRSFWRSYGMTKNFKRHKLDIYHGLSNELPINSHFLRTRTIVTIHDLIFIRYPELYQPVDRKIYYKKFKAACQKSDKIIAISEQTKSDIINFFDIKEEKIDVVYQGCNEIFYKKQSEECLEKIRKKYKLPEDFILNVGTVEARKNALQIVKAVHHAKIDIPIVIIGRKTEYQNEIEYYIHKNSVKAPVIFINNVKFTHLPAIYQMARVFAFPSIFEGFGIPILEAMNSGVPVVTSKGSCFPETGGEGALYSFPEDYENLAENINLALFNEEIRSKLILAGKKQALKFRDREVANNLMKVYRSLF